MERRAFESVALGQPNDAPEATLADAALFIEQALAQLLGLPAVELDLSCIAPPITMAELRAWVVERLEHKTWLFNPRKAALQEAAEAEAGAALTQA